MKAATGCCQRAGVQESEISIHAAREGGDGLQSTIDTASKISIHAAREGGDWGDSLLGRCTQAFQSTPPVKAATDV